MTRGLVSVIVPVYNGSQWLSDLVESLRAQSHTQWEALFVDDSSTDNSYPLLCRLAETDSRIRVFRKPNGRFACKGIAYGLERARGEWFFYMSQDDVISPDLFAEAVATARRCDAEAVVPRMLTWSRHDEGAAQLRPGPDPGTELTPLEAFAESVNWRIHGFALFGMELVRRVGVTTEFINSDEFDTRMFFYFSNRVCFSGGEFRYHTGNPEAITRKWIPEQTGFIDCAVRLHDFAVSRGHTGRIADECVRRVADECLGCLRKLARSGQSDPEARRRLWGAIDAARRVWNNPRVNGRRVTLLLRHPLGRRLSFALLAR